MVTKIASEKQQMMDWFLRIDWEYAGTVNLDSSFSYKMVAKNFVRNLNKAIFGRSNVKRSPDQFKLFVLPVYADDTANKHIHFAFAGFPENCDESQITYEFNKAARQTKGIKTAFAGNLPAVHIEPITSASSESQNSETWLMYILRYTKNLNDKHLLLELANLDTRITFDHICENIIDLRSNIAI